MKRIFALSTIAALIAVAAFFSMRTPTRSAATQEAPRQLTRSQEKIISSPVANMGHIEVAAPKGCRECVQFGDELSQALFTAGWDSFGGGRVPGEPRKGHDVMVWNGGSAGDGVQILVADLAKHPPVADALAATLKSAGLDFAWTQRENLGAFIVHPSPGPNPVRRTAIEPKQAILWIGPRS